MDDLLPCPFCGWKPNGWEHISRGPVTSCFTKGCPANGNLVEISVWNTRTPSPASPSPVGEGQPVAWQWRPAVSPRTRERYGENNPWPWTVCSKEAFNEPHPDNEYRELFAAQAPKPASGGGEIGQREQETVDALAQSHAFGVSISDKYAAIHRSLRTKVARWRTDSTTLHSPDGKAVLAQCADELEQAITAEADTAKENDNEIKRGMANTDPFVLADHAAAVADMGTRAVPVLNPPAADSSQPTVAP